MITFARALTHLEVYKRFGEKKPSELALYEFGAGWDLVGPLTLWACGVDSQTLVDIRPNLRPELIEDTVPRLPGALRAAGVEDSRDFPNVPAWSVRELGTLGIEYRAPCDARQTGLGDASLDLITSTYTLEHIPAADIADILVESRRILRPDGIISASVDFKDHYSYVDSSIGPYNFLRFSDRTWRLVNSSLHFQNRLRLPDYRKMIEAAGFLILDEEILRPSQEALEGLQDLELAPRFAGRYELDDLAAQTCLFVARSA